jgi:hypothetical protein
MASNEHEEETSNDAEPAKEIGKEIGEALFGGRKWATFQERLLETCWLQLSNGIAGWEELSYEEKEALFCDALDSALVYTRLTVFIEVLERRAILGQEEGQIVKKNETTTQSMVDETPTPK